MKTLRTFIISTFIALLGFVFSSTLQNIAYAQDIPSTINPITLSSSPENPSPGDSVTITAVSYVIDINAANLSWTVNGTPIKKGIGVTSIMIKAPSLGKTSIVSVGGALPSGQQIANSIEVSSGGVDMVIETDGYVPPFFLGKILPAYQNTVRIIAIPHLANSAGVEYDPSTLIYKWTADTGTVISDQSGYGKQAIDLPGGLIPRGYAMTVDVTTRDGTKQTSGSASVVPQSPSLSFYPVDPLYGPLYNKAVGDTLYISSQKEASVIAAPWGLNKTTGNISGDDIVRNWTINTLDHPELDSGDVVVLRAPNGTSGSSDIQLSINSTANILQRLSGGFTVNFQ